MDQARLAQTADGFVLTAELDDELLLLELLDDELEDDELLDDDEDELEHVMPPAAVPIRDNADDGREGKYEQPFLVLYRIHKVKLY